MMQLDTEPMRTLVGFVAHPLAGDVEANLARARRWLRWLIREHPQVAFCMPWLPYCEVLDDGDPADRERGRRDSLSCLRGCHLLFLVGGLLTVGMRAELDLALSLDLAVIDYLLLGAEPP